MYYTGNMKIVKTQQVISTTQDLEVLFTDEELHVLEAEVGDFVEVTIQPAVDDASLAGR